MKLSFPVFDKADQRFCIIKVIVITIYSVTVIYDPVLLVLFKAIQQFFFSVPLNKQRKTIRFEFRKQSFSAIQIAVIAMTDIFSKEHFLFSHQSLSGQSPELQPLQCSFSLHRQQASPQRAIPNSLFMYLQSSFRSLSAAMVESADKSNLSVNP